jgi:hypothetical protein
LIRSGIIKIGELDNFYSIVLELGNKEKDMIRGFVKSILEIRNDIGNSTMKIEQLSHGGKVIECRLSDLMGDYLGSIN